MGPGKKEKTEKPQWHQRFPNLQLYMRITYLYRGASFMNPEQFAQLLEMLKEETRKCSEDADGRCIGLSLQVEAMRQAEEWEEVVRLASEAESLQSAMTED